MYIQFYWSPSLNPQSKDRLMHQSTADYECVQGRSSRHRSSLQWPWGWSCLEPTVPHLLKLLEHKNPLNAISVRPCWHLDDCSPSERPVEVDAILGCECPHLEWTKQETPTLKLFPTPPKTPASILTKTRSKDETKSTLSSPMNCSCSHLTFASFHLH
jgi:hypothetical protein